MSTYINQHTIWRKTKVLEETGLGATSLYNRMNKNSLWYDPTFPKCFKLSTSTARNAASGWLAIEVIAWIQQKKDAALIKS